MIVIISPTETIAAILAEQIELELKIPAVILQATDVPPPETRLIVSEGALPQKPVLPVITLTRPIILRDLLAEIRKIVQQAAPEAVQIAKGVTFLPRAGELKTKKQQVALTDKEAQLLQLLIEHSGIAPKELLLKKLWGFEPGIDTHTLETHIYRLRAKLREVGCEDIITAGDGGYAIEMK